MKKLMATASVLAALLPTSAAAVSPSAQASATAKIYKPLTIAKASNLDFGTIVTSNSAFTNETVTVTTTGSVVCGSGAGFVTCGGTPTAAKFHLTGSNNAVVTVTSPGFSLTGPGPDIPVTPSSTTQNVNLGASGSVAGVDVPLGGSIVLSNTTPVGTYTGTWTVTADYQ